MIIGEQYVCEKLNMQSVGNGAGHTRSREKRDICIYGTLTLDLATAGFRKVAHKRDAMPVKGIVS